MLGCVLADGSEVVFFQVVGDEIEQLSRKVILGDLELFLVLVNLELEWRY